MSKPRTDILLLASPSDTTSIVFNHLARRFGIFYTIMEAPNSKTTIIKTRLRKLGVLNVLSQLAFLTTIRPILQWRSLHIIEQHCRTLRLDRRAIPREAIVNIPSVNHEACRQALQRLRPRVIVVNGTRIIGANTLGSTEAQFINIHAGITPQYRGSNGAYWALHRNDPERCGVTVHLVDEGIDTGDILAQALISPSTGDSFVTYPYLQIAAALPLLEQVVAHALNGHVRGRQPEGNSQVWYHPGVIQYLTGRLRGVR